jgi:hypothetical protein
MMYHVPIDIKTRMNKVVLQRDHHAIKLLSHKGYAFLQFGRGGGVGDDCVVASVATVVIAVGCVVSSAQTELIGSRCWLR